MKHFTTRISMLALLLAMSGRAAIAGEDLAFEESPDAYQLTAILDHAYGEELVAGEFAGAITDLAHAKIRRNTAFPIKNNLCIAYILARDLGNAKPACDAAVQIAESNLRSADYFSVRSKLTDKGIALSNRGVALALSGDLGSAMRDLNAAVRLRIDLTQATNNLARVQAKAIARVAAR